MPLRSILPTTSILLLILCAAPAHADTAAESAALERLAARKTAILADRQPYTERLQQLFDHQSREQLKPSLLAKPCPAVLDLQSRFQALYQQELELNRRWRRLLDDYVPLIRAATDAGVAKAAAEQRAELFDKYRSWADRAFYETGELLRYAVRKKACAEPDA